MKKTFWATGFLLALLLAALLLPSAASAGEITKVTVLPSVGEKLIAGQTFMDQDLATNSLFSQFVKMVGMDETYPASFAVQWTRSSGSSWVGVSDNEEIKSNTKYCLRIEIGLSGDHFASDVTVQSMMDDMDCQKGSYKLIITGTLTSQTHYGDFTDYNPINVTGTAFTGTMEDGAVPSKNVVPDDLYGYNGNYTIHNVKWYPTGYPYDSVTRFEAGVFYTLSFEIHPGYNTTFESTAAVSLDGIISTDDSFKVSRKSGTEWLIVTWDCPWPAFKSIDKVVLGGLVPVCDNDYPQKEGFNSKTDHVSVKLLEWRDQDGNKQTFAFDLGEKYTAYLELETDDPSVYSIADDVTVVVNVGDVRMVLNNWDGVARHVAVVDFIAQPKLVTEISLSPDKFILNATADNPSPTMVMTVNITPSGVTNPAVAWLSDDEDVATVDASGTITAVGEGTCTVICSALDGSGVTGSCEVTVKHRKTEQVELNSHAEYMIITGDGPAPAFQLKATVAPTDAVNRNVAWKSSDTNVVKVDNKGKVTAVAEGTATVTCTAKDGSGAEDECVFHVSGKRVEEIVLNSSYQLLTRTSVKPAPTFQLKATVNPESALNRNVIWTSDSPDVATVDASGKVTAVGLGICNIQCEAKDGSGVAAICTIEVDVRTVTGIALNHDHKTLKIGEEGQSLDDLSEVQLTATVTPDDALNKNVIWVTDNELVAVIDENGKVTAKGEGTCLITCIAEDGAGATAYCDITVEVKPDVKSVTVKNGIYSLSGTTAALTGVKKSTVTTLAIQDTVEANGKTYKVTSVGSSACSGLAKLKTVKIGKYVKTIGKRAFWKCTALKTVSGGAAVVTISDNAFAWCTKLNSLPAFGKLQTIGSGAFQQCKGMKAFTIPANVKKIGSKAFFNCVNAKKFVIKTKKLTQSSVGANAFSNTPKSAVMKCPSAKLKAYKKFMSKKGFRGKVQ